MKCTLTAMNRNYNAGDQQHTLCLTLHTLLVNVLEGKDRRKERRKERRKWVVRGSYRGCEELTNTPDRCEFMQG